MNTTTNNPKTAPAGQNSGPVTPYLDGDLIWCQGHEFIVREPRVMIGTDGIPVFRYRGECSTHPCNDSIRHTGYNGGTYGYRVDAVGKLHGLKVS